MTQATQGKQELTDKIMRALARSEDYKLQGDHKKALSVAEKILMDNPECLEAVEEVADNLLSLERLEAAEKAAQYAVKLDHETYIGNFVLGFIASQQEEWKNAVRHLTLANKGQANNAEIIRCLGWALFHNNQSADGLMMLKRALQLRGDDTQILCDLAACALQMTDTETARHYLERSLRLDMNDFRAIELMRVADRLDEAPA